MSKYIIKKNDGSVYEVDSLSSFCKEVGITERLLRYTNPLLKGKKEDIKSGIKDIKYVVMKK